MKKLFIALFVLIIAGNCFAADLLKVGDKQLYKTTLGEDNDEVIIGDPNSVDFKPQLKFTKWDEVSLSIIVPDDLITDKTPKIKDTKTIEIGDSKTGFYFNRFDDDNFKFGIIWKEKPTSNSWSAGLDGWKDFDFFYQDTLTNEVRVGDLRGRAFIVTENDCFDQDGKVLLHRPENIVGSYAIYHKSKKNHIVGQTNYKHGKFGHILRPKFIDANGDWVWGGVQIKDGIFTETCPQDFLNKATYPVKSNAEFGNNDTVGSSFWLDNIINIAFAFIDTTALASSGSLTQASLYFDGNGGSTTTNHQIGIYLDDTTAPTTLIGNTASFKMPSAYYAGWVNSAISGSVVSGNKYWLAVNCDGYNTSTVYDTVTSGLVVYKTMTFGTWSNPYGAHTDSVYRLAVYATYTPSGGAVGKVIMIMGD